MSFLDSGFIKRWPVPKSLRLDVPLQEPSDTSFTSVNYLEILNAANGLPNPLHLHHHLPENTSERYNDYEEESYIDNSEALFDSYPRGTEPEIPGFFINQGELKIKSIYHHRVLQQKRPQKKDPEKKKAKKVRKKDEALIPKKPTYAKDNPDRKLDTLIMSFRKQRIGKCGKVEALTSSDRKSLLPKTATSNYFLNRHFDHAYAMKGPKNKPSKAIKNKNKDGTSKSSSKMNKKNKVKPLLDINF